MRPAPRALTVALVFVSGLAALSWEVLWQIRASLAIGVSAMGTAVTLAATMGGMTLGALTMGRALQRRAIARPLRVYGMLEVVVGLAGLLFLPGFALLERIDGALFLRARASFRSRTWSGCWWCSVCRPSRWAPRCQCSG